MSDNRAEDARRKSERHVRGPSAWASAGCALAGSAALLWEDKSMHNLHCIITVFGLFLSRRAALSLLLACSAPRPRRAGERGSSHATRLRLIPPAGALF